MNAAAPFSAPVTIPVACITAVAVALLLGCAILALLSPENDGHHCEPDHVDRLGAWLRGRLHQLRARAAAASARPGQTGTAPVPASGAVPPDYQRADGVIHIEPDGSITVRPRAAIPPELAVTAADGIAVIGEPFRVPPWVPENSYDDAEVTG